MSTRRAHSPDSRDGVRLGSYPTPLWRVDGLRDAQHELWVKDDGRTAAEYGGNKVRKLERLLTLARGRGARRLLTVGAAGSHHVLATCLYGARLGLPTWAVLTPQPRSAHAEATLRAALRAGLTAVPARSPLDAALALRRERRPGDFSIGPGGWGCEGTWAYRLAVDELREQMVAAGLGELDAIFVAAGSGSTAAGLVAGILRTGVARRVVAVPAAANPALRLMIIGQALHALWRHDQLVSPLDALRALRLDPRFIGRGYGYSSDPAARAMELARSFGLAVEPTYTAKAFAAATSWVTAPRGDKPRSKLRLHERRTYLYWHTLSAVPLDALLAGAPETLPRELARLLFEPSSPNPS
ncbi:MAG TPA: pyridoxal-phosphate dependent enzyme [Polyangiaceae bacterium]|nr:pyridoxal-phosphate dependent enzyme [Polyangiaceae bacterium]